MFVVSNFAQDEYIQMKCFYILAKAQNSPVYKRSWFVAVVVIVIFLLIVLLVALLITRKRGERYPGECFTVSSPGAFPGSC
jgi:uncharacterized membrane protein AbrB (regulator of aidB expression)